MYKVRDNEINMNYNMMKYRNEIKRLNKYLCSIILNLQKSR